MKQLFDDQGADIGTLPHPMDKNYHLEPTQKLQIYSAYQFKNHTH